ncbi:MAG: DNA-binding protein [Candidatus Thermoplasmatota archaeon]|nr:DNA-binding protein [Candidatus Thermoplasmatota archaeon]
MDDELERLRKKRAKELQQQINAEESIEDQRAEEQQFEEQKKTILRSILTTEARERLTNIKLARPAVGEQIENQLIMLAQSGRLQQKITDAILRELLAKIMPKKRDINIKRR